MGNEPGNYRPPNPDNTASEDAAKTDKPGKGYIKSGKYSAFWWAKRAIVTTLLVGGGYVCHKACNPPPGEAYFENKFFEKKPDRKMETPEPDTILVYPAPDTLKP